MAALGSGGARVSGVRVRQCDHIESDGDDDGDRGGQGFLPEHADMESQGDQDIREFRLCDHGRKRSERVHERGLRTGNGDTE